MPDTPRWTAWAPPIDPPTPGGLSAATAQQIADDTGYPEDPHLTAALQWDAYAATLPPTPVVSQVATGAQSVSYSPATAVGEFGLAVTRAEWHRQFLDTAASVPLTRG